MDNRVSDCSISDFFRRPFHWWHTAIVVSIRWCTLSCRKTSGKNETLFQYSYCSAYSNFIKRKKTFANTFNIESSRSSVILITNGRRTIICVSMYNSVSVLTEQQNTEYKIPAPLTFTGLSNKHFIQFCVFITNVNTVTFTREIHLVKVMFSCNMIFIIVSHPVLTNIWKYFVVFFIRSIKHVYIISWQLILTWSHY